MIRPSLKLRRGRKQEVQPRYLTPAEEAEYLRCWEPQSEAKFVYWCESHVRIIGDRGECPFILWPGQRRMVGPLVRGLFLMILKGRQLGFTWLFAAYFLWLLMFRKSITIFVVNQELMYAEEFITRIEFMHSRLPEWCKREISKQTEKRMHFGESGGVSRIIAIAGGTKAARSFTADYALFDEASRIADFAATVGAVQPAIEKRDGQIACLTTSAGPVEGFYDLWTATYGDHGEKLNAAGCGPTGFTPFFLHWSEAPGREGDWYDRQKALLDALSPVLVKQEYPKTIQEAWEQAAGRCFPQFGPMNFGTVSVTRDFVRYRAVDWGETKSAYVVLWIAVLPKAPPGLLVHPDCVNTIREMTHYRFDEATGRPRKGEDHTVDALRYAVTTFKLTGLVFVYREIYRPQSLTLGYTPMKEIKELHEMSGWQRGGITDRESWQPGRKAELFENTVFDRSLGKMGALFRDHKIPCKASVQLKGRSVGKEYKDPVYAELLEGIRFINNLIDGTELIATRVAVRRPKAPMMAAGIPESVGSIDRRRRALAEQYLRRRR